MLISVDSTSINNRKGVESDLDTLFYKEVIMSKYLISVKVNQEKYEYFEVPEEIYIYIKQLETSIKTGYTKGISKLYPERFKS